MNHSVLFPDAKVRARWDNHLTARLARAEQNVSQGPVSPTINFESFNAGLARFDFEAAEDFGEVLDWTIGQMETGLVHINHPRYFGLFNPAPSFPAQCAERIVSSFNPQLASATTSPAAVAIEAHVIRAVAQRAGLGSQAAGHFTSGGSDANFTAVICALTSANSDFASIGARAFSGQPVFYISQDSHLAWIKIAHQAGIGRDAARLIPTGGDGRMSIDALNAALQTDREAGCVPFMIVATAGTTNAGMIDPLSQCAGIAQQDGLWFHVDAAWGGALIASNNLRGRLAGIGSADSVTIDAHKWFATTMGCGMFLTGRPSVLNDAFNVATSFMPSYAAGVDPYVTTTQWSRRFLGLRLFLSLAAGGWAAHGAHVEHSFEMINCFTETVQELGWSVVNPQALAVACIVPQAGSASVREIVRRVVASGAVWISATAFEGRDVIRACVTHGETSQADVFSLVDALEQARRC